MLDMASGPIQYPEYLVYSSNFKKRYCVDLSKNALEAAKKKDWRPWRIFAWQFFKS